MEIYPQRQLAMFLAALWLGGSMGGLHVLVLALRTLVGAYLPPEEMRARYARPLPLLGKAVGFDRGATRRVWRALVIFVTDLCFCLVFCVRLILLLYRYNDGAWRLSVPLLCLLGFAFFVLLVRRFFAHLNDDAAYFLAVALLYFKAALLLPIRLVLRLLRRFVWRPLQNRWYAACEKRRESYTQKTCRAELLLAAQGMLTEERKKKNVEKEDHAFGLDATLSDHGTVLRGTVRGMESP